jgi:3-oxoacyl-[acyl-carrier protein] reductase
MGLLDGKVVIVTGGGHGIGKAYCLGIAREGGTAVVADIDDIAADGVAKAIIDSGGKALGVKVDVSDFTSCEVMAKKTLDAYGKIDGLVNNAAIFMSVPAEKGSFQTITEAEWDRIMAVNVKVCGCVRVRLCRQCSSASREASSTSLRIWRSTAVRA